MHDPWVDRLSEYLDGELAARDERALEQHLAACDVCRSTLAELRAVVAAARSLEDSPPGHDLWPTIAAAITAAPARDIVDVAVVRSARRARRISFSVPQLAAAAVLLMAVSSAGMWLLTGGARSTGGEAVTGTIVQSASSDAEGVTLVSSTVAPDPEYDATIARLEQMLADNRAQLEPATIDVIERSMEAIDRALSDARSALEADPGNPYLYRQLESTKRKKLDVLRRASSIQRAGA